MPKTKIILVGGGGHCRAVLDVILATEKYEIAGIIDIKENVGKEILGFKIIGTDENLKNLRQEVDSAIITIGHIKDNKPRVVLYDKLKKLNYTLPVIISPFAYVSKFSSIGEGTVIMHQALVNANAKIGVNCIINTKSLIEHDAIIGNHCHISTAAVVNGGVVIGDHTFLGSNSTTIQTKKYDGFFQAGMLHKGDK